MNIIINVNELYSVIHSLKEDFALTTYDFFQQSDKIIIPLTQFDETLQQQLIKYFTKRIKNIYNLENCLKQA